MSYGCGADVAAGHSKERKGYYVSVSMAQVQNLLHTTFSSSVPWNCNFIRCQQNQIKSRKILQTEHPTRTLNSTLVISWKPSWSLGSLYRAVKLVKAILGSMVRFSGLSFIIHH